MNGRTTRRVLAGALAALVTTVVGAGVAGAAVPDKWEKRTNVCQTLSLYAYNPGYGGVNAPAAHQVSGYKRLYWTSGEIVNGWTPVYSAGQEEWHTVWVRGECLANGWGYPDTGHVDY